MKEWLNDYYKWIDNKEAERRFWILILQVVFWITMLISISMWFVAWNIPACWFRLFIVQLVIFIIPFILYTIF